MKLKPIPLIVAALFGASGAQAATYYVCDCQTGAHASCAAGNTAATDTANTGTNPAVPRRNTAARQSLFNAAAAGDSVLSCRGGAWDNARLDLQNTNATASNRITLGAYTPTWCTGDCATQDPIFTESRAGTDGIDFDNSGADGGYIVENINLQGGGTGLWGIFTSGNVSDITVRNVTIDGFGIGWHCGENLDRMKLLNSRIINNPDQGALWGCQNSVVEGNEFDNNGGVNDPAWTDDPEDDYHFHNIYAGITASGVNLTIRNNTLTRNSILTNQCRSPSLVLHGQWDGVLIEGNDISEATTAMKDGCYGIAVDPGYGTTEYFRNVIIRANKLRNMGNTAIGCAACTRPIIENNEIVLEQPTGTGAMTAYYGIAIPDRNLGAGDDADTGAIIRNNGSYLAWAPADSNCINVGEYSAGSGTNIQITSNLCYFGTGVNSNHACFDLGDRVIGNFTAFTSNACYHANGNGRWSTTYATLANARAAGFDLGAANLDQDPLFVALPASGNSWSFRLQSSSPLVNNADTTYKATSSSDGYPALGARDIGPREYGRGQ